MKYIGTIIWNVIGVLFCIAVLNSVYDNFETLVVSLLVLTLAGVNQGFASANLAGGGRFLVLYRKMIELKFPEKDDVENKESYEMTDEKIESDELTDAEKTLTIATKKFWIAATGNLIIWIVAILKIVGSL